MYSAFGVEHGISKSWAKLQPKLSRVTHTARPTDDMAQRMKVNYAQWRTKAGYQSKDHGLLTRGIKSWEKSDDKLKDFHINSNKRQLAELPVRGKRLKEASNVAITSHTKNRRKNRVLP